MFPVSVSKQLDHLISAVKPHLGKKTRNTNRGPAKMKKNSILQRSNGAVDKKETEY